MERQYRHAAQPFLWEVPAGRLEPGEDPLEGARRELEEETGYRAKKWSELVEYYASPGFLGESMKVFLAEGLVPGDSRPEEDELIEMRLVRLSELLKTIEKGGIMDGKTLSASCFMPASWRESEASNSAASSHGKITKVYRQFSQSPMLWKLGPDF